MNQMKVSVLQNTQIADYTARPEGTVNRHTYSKQLLFFAKVKKRFAYR